MKKFALALLACCYFLTATGQPNTWLLYGTAGFDTYTYNINSSNDNTLSTWNVKPGIGYQFNQHITAGVQGGYSYTSYSNQPFYLPGVPVNIPYIYYGVPSNTYSWSVGAFARYTQWLGSIFFVYGQVNMSYISSGMHYNDGYSYIRSNTVYSATDLYSDGIQATVFPGIGINVYKGLALTFDFGGISYLNQSQDNVNGGQDKTSHFGVNFAQQINIGISKNLSMHFHHHKHGHAEPGMELRHNKKAKDDDDDDDDASPAKKKQ